MKRFNLPLALIAVLTTGASAQTNYVTNDWTADQTLHDATSINDASTPANPPAVDLSGNSTNPAEKVPAPAPVEAYTAIRSESNFRTARPLAQAGPGAVPTPPSWLALGVGLVGFASVNRKKFRSPRS